MKSKVKSLFKDAAIYGLGGLLGKGIGFFLMPLYTRLFSPSDYGIMELLNVIGTCLGIVISMGMESALSFYFFQQKKEGIEAQAKVVTSVFQWYLIFGLATVLVSVLLSPLINHFFFDGKLDYKYFAVIFFSVFFVQVINLSLNVFRMLFKAWSYIFITILQSALAISVGLFFIMALDWGIYGYFVGNLTGAFLVFFISIGGIREYLQWTGIDKSWWIKILKFGIPLVPGSLSIYFLHMADRWFINYYINTYELGLYAVAAQFAIVIGFAINTFNKAFLPHSMNLLAEQDVKQGEKTFELLFRYYLAAAFGFIILLNYAAPHFIKIFAAPEYYPAYNIIGILSLSSAFWGGTYFSCLGTWKVEKTYLFSISVFVAMIVSIILNYLLIPSLGIYGASLATTAGMMLLFVLSFYFSHINYKIAFSFKTSFIQTFLLLLYFTVFGLFSEKIAPGGAFSLLLSAFCVVMIIAVTVKRKEMKMIRFMRKQTES